MHFSDIIELKFRKKLPYIFHIVMYVKASKKFWLLDYL